MALSNIFREPRREITESAVGITLVSAFVFADYLFASWLVDEGTKHPTEDLILGMVMGVGVLGIVVGGTILTHALGESLCNKLEKAGIQMRPRTRRR